MIKRKALAIISTLALLNSLNAYATTTIPDGGTFPETFNTGAVPNFEGNGTRTRSLRPVVPNGKIPDFVHQAMQQVVQLQEEPSTPKNNNRELMQAHTIDLKQGWAIQVQKLIA